MDRHSWLWRRKSSSKSPGETESSGSFSSRSGRYSDEQDMSRASLSDASPNNIHLPEFLPNISDNDAHDSIKTLSEKLSAALSDLGAKEGLVKQHAKVAEEAVSGWEKAGIEVTTLKQQLEGATKKNSILEERIIYLDDALKECVKQLRKCKVEQEQRINDSLNNKSLELELCKAAFESQHAELQAPLDESNSGVSDFADNALHTKLQFLEKENSNLKMELHARLKDLEIRTLERDFSIQSSEAASKQNLVSIKKVAKLEAECRKLQNMAHKCSLFPVSESKPLANSMSMEIFTGSQPAFDESLLAFHVRTSSYDSWAPAFISELDQFKSEKASARNNTTSVELDLMDDFLEMERLAALPDVENSHSTNWPSSEEFTRVDSGEIVPMGHPLKIIHEPRQEEIDELESKIKKVENERNDLETALAHTKVQLECTTNILIATKSRLFDLQRKLDLANESKNAAAMEIVVLDTSWKKSESKLVAAQLEIDSLHNKLCLVENRLEEERAVSAEFSSQTRILESTKTTLESQLESAHADFKILGEKLHLVQAKFEDETKTSADFECRVQVLEATIKALESQLESAHLDSWELRDKVGSSNRELDEERKASLAYLIKLEGTEADKKELELQIESINMEITKLRDEAKLLEGKVEEERASAAFFSSTCTSLEIELARKKQETDFQQVATSNGVRKIKQEAFHLQEKELSVAKDKLADCQKTIASLGMQLKSLMNFDDFILDVSNPECNVSSQDYRESDAQELLGGYFSEKCVRCSCPAN